MFVVFFSILATAQTVLTVFAAASLNAAFPTIGKSFEAAHPGVSVRFDFDGSQVLVLQLSQGAPADVFASADERWMDKAKSQGLVTDSAPFASNSLVIVVAKNSSVSTAGDLAKPGVRVVLCADAVPCGRYGREMLTKMARDSRFGSGFDEAVMRNVVSDEQNVEDVFAKISLGAADCGIVYRSDLMSRTDLANGDVRAVELPAAYQPSISYPIATVTKSGSSLLAAEFVTFVRSTQGQSILRRYGFGPAP